MAERKLNIDGAVVDATEEAKATYKAIPQDDIESINTNKPTVVVNTEKRELDGADEKLLASKGTEGKIIRVDMADAKYVVGDHRNGDAKIELDAGKAFSGLTKEELMKYANDPFWVRLRWAMFILFWVMWLAMLASAIIIIVRTPKCPAPEPRPWYAMKPMVEDATLQDLDDLASRSVEGVSLPADLIEANTYAVLEPDYKPSPQLIEYAEEAKKQGLKLIMDLKANVARKTSEWFKKSEEGVEEFKDYFIWRPASGNDGDTPKVPNNWLTRDSRSAWTWSPTRKEFYLHQLGEETPDLNFYNDKVVQMFTDVLNYWLAAGVSGFRLSSARQLLVDQLYRDEPVASKPSEAVVNTYGFYNHIYTMDQKPRLDELIARWSAVVKEKGGFLSVSEPLTCSSLCKNSDVLYTEIPNGDVVDLLAAPQQIVHKLKPLVNVWPRIKFISDPLYASELFIVSMLLPAVPVYTTQQLQLNTNINEWKLSKQYNYLLELRKQPSISHGDTKLYSVNDTFAYTRYKAGTSGYLVVYNPTTNKVKADLSSIEGLPALVTADVISSNYNGDIEQNKNVMSSNVTMGANSAIVFLYNPVVIE